jgi:predicted DNA-binding transcriptional regulator YafY
VLNVVQQALLYDQQFEVDYQSTYANKRSRQTLHPLALVQRGPVTYLVATAFDYPDIRLYTLHRMNNVVATNQPVKRPADFNLDKYIASGALQFGQNGTLQLKARVTEELAGYLTETALSEDQSLHADGDGYQLTATVNDSWQLRWWILSQGAGIVVLEPLELNEEIAQSIKQAANNYV